MTDATSVIAAIRELAKANTEPVSVKFIAGERSFTFDIILAQHESDYYIKRIEKTPEGKWVHPKPPSEPPGEIYPTWVRVTTEGIIIGASKFSDTEFIDWLKGYASATGSVSERSALVLDAEPGVNSVRLFEVLAMQGVHGLDRFLIEKEAKQQDDVPEVPHVQDSEESNDSDLD